MEPQSWTYDEFPPSTWTAEGMKCLSVSSQELSVHALPPVVYAQSETRPLTLRILQPSGVAAEMMEDRRFPLIIFVQGSGWRWQNPESNICTLGRIVRAGYVVAMVQYRGSEEAPFPAQLLDVKRAVRFMQAHGHEFHADPSQLILWGNSSGGHLVSMTAVTQGIMELEPEAIPVDLSSLLGVIDFYGPMELSSMQDEPSAMDHNSPSSIDGQLLGGIAVDQHPEAAARASVLPYFHEGMKLPPFLILHGDKDRSVPMGQSVRLFEKLRTYGFSAEFYKVLGADHGGAGLWNDQIMDLCLETMRHWRQD